MKTTSTLNIIMIAILLLYSGPLFSQGKVKGQISVNEKAGNGAAVTAHTCTVEVPKGLKVDFIKIIVKTNEGGRPGAKQFFYWPYAKSNGHGVFSRSGGQVTFEMGNLPGTEGISVLLVRKSGNGKKGPRFHYTEVDLGTGND